MRQPGSAPLSHAPTLPSYDPDDIDEVPGGEAEEAEEQIVDQATAAATLAELEAEIIILKDLEERALRLKQSGQDAKWRELESILDEPLMLDAATGLRRKVIIFTEPKDTLEYLQQKLRICRAAKCFNAEASSSVTSPLKRGRWHTHWATQKDATVTRAGAAWHQ